MKLNKKGLRRRCLQVFARKLPLILTSDFLEFFPSESFRLERLLLDVLVYCISEHS